MSKTLNMGGMRVWCWGQALCLGCGAVEGPRRGGLTSGGFLQFLLLPLQLFPCLEIGEIWGPPVGCPVPE